MANKSKKKVAINNRIIYIVCVGVVLLTLTLFNYTSYLSSEKPNTVTQEPENKELRYWYAFLEEHPDYYPGWLAVARLEYNEGNKEGAIQALVQAEKIFPNSDEVKYYKLVFSN